MVAGMPKKNRNQTNHATRYEDNDREGKILNLLCNTSLVLMTMLTEAVSQMFTTIGKGMMDALSTCVGGSANASIDLDDLEKQIPEKLRTELMTMKKDLQQQFYAKKHEIGTFLADPRFDTGIGIVERTQLPLPKLTEDLDERSLFAYLALLQTEDAKVSAMFKELFEWMNSLPQLGKKADT